MEAFYKIKKQLHLEMFTGMKNGVAGMNQVSRLKVKVTPRGV
jgi:hypothetical protein